MTPERDDLRDDGVVRAWREHVRDTPPPDVDDAIRATARRAVGAKPREKAIAAEARGPWRWWMPLAAAATIGAVAIGVLQNLPQESAEPTVVSDAVTARRAAPETPAAPMQAAPPTVAPSPPEVAPAKKAASAAAAEQRDRTPLPMPRTQPQREAPPATAPGPASAPKIRQDAAKPDVASSFADSPSESKEKSSVPPPSDDRQRAASPPDKQEQVAALEKRAPSKDVEPRRNERDGASGFVASPPPASAPAPAVTDSLGAARESSNAAEPTARAKQRAAPTSQPMAAAPPALAAGARGMAEPQAMAVTPPDVFVAEIRRLLAAGDRDGAVRELQRFRRTHVDADARLPVELRGFAATVPR